MSNAKKISTPPVSPTSTPPQPQDEADLPILAAISVTKVPAGWVLIYLETQGTRVIHKEILDGPAGKSQILDAGKVEYVKRFMMSRPGVNA